MVSASRIQSACILINSGIPTSENETRLTNTRTKSIISNINTYYVPSCVKKNNNDFRVMLQITENR